MDFDIASLSQLFNSAFQHQVTQFTISFGLAAYIHSKQVNKEIKAQGQEFIASLNSIADALRADMAAQSKRLAVIEEDVGSLHCRTKQCPIIEKG